MHKYSTSIIKYLLITSCLVLLSACTVNKDFREGQHYKRITPELAKQETHEKIEVIEMFFYGCPHCYELEPKIDRWVEKNANVISFQRMPAIVAPSWITQAKAYYIAQELGLLDKLHTVLFEKIHKQGKQYYNDYTLMEFFINQGVERSDFIQANNSTTVAEKLNNARVMTVKYGLRGVPAVIINGKYKTAPFYTRTQEEMFEVLDSLIEQETTLIKQKQ
ncbi:MAG: thioredoxin domain-containing protein [Methylomarinum sp.]|nr:thioredoxin domain-containing protein [Methylomarinum sp.]